MTIKKTIKKTVIKQPEAGAPAGGAAIADRFKLAPAQPVAAAGGKTSSTIALVAGLIALAAAGILLYIIYQHWVFLMPA